MAELPQRKSPRLQGYDYATTGGYFVTICTDNKSHLFGEIVNGVMCLSDIGQVANRTWFTIPDVFVSVKLGDFVVMSNHCHGIIFLDEHPEYHPTLGNVIGNYKGTVTREVKRSLKSPPLPLWQSRFYDHIIRDEIDGLRIRKYIQNNVARWADDSLNDEL